MEIKNNKFYIVNKCSKTVLDKEFDKKQDAEKVLLMQGVNNDCFKFSRGLKLNRIKSKGTKLEEKPYNEFKERLDRIEKEEENRVKILKERGLFYK